MYQIAWFCFLFDRIIIWDKRFILVGGRIPPLDLAWRRRRFLCPWQIIFTTFESGPLNKCAADDFAAVIPPLTSSWHQRKLPFIPCINKAIPHKERLLTSLIQQGGRHPFKLLPFLCWHKEKGGGFLSITLNNHKGLLNQQDISHKDHISLKYSRGNLIVADPAKQEPLPPPTLS